MSKKKPVKRRKYKFITVAPAPLPAVVILTPQADDLLTAGTAVTAGGFASHALCLGGLNAVLIDATDDSNFQPLPVTVIGAAQWQTTYSQCSSTPPIF